MAVPNSIRILPSRPVIVRWLTLGLAAFGLAFGFPAQAADAWQTLVVADGPAASTSSSPAPPRGVRVTYLGTNGYLLQSRGSTLIIDPYFTRAGVLQVGLGLPLTPSKSRIDEALAQLPKRVDAILVTHGHIDHLLDASPLAVQTHARLLASPTSVRLARAAGLPEGRALAMLPGVKRRIGSARITTLPAAHDRVLGCWTPYPGILSTEPKPPRSAPDWLCGEPLAYLIEMGGQRIYIDSGGMPGVLPPANLAPVDLAIVGVALGDSRARLDATLDRLRPRVFLPSHQDDFFRPLSAGFRFGLLTDFPGVRRIAARHPTHLIMLDYFKSWTLR